MVRAKGFAMGEAMSSTKVQCPRMGTILTRALCGAADPLPLMMPFASQTTCLPPPLPSQATHRKRGTHSHIKLHRATHSHTKLHRATHSHAQPHRATHHTQLRVATHTAARNQYTLGFSTHWEREYGLGGGVFCTSVRAWGLGMDVANLSR